MVRQIVVAALMALSLAGCSDSRKQLTREQVDRVANELDAKTTKTGVYVRVVNPELAERDGWGTPLRVSYSQGGVAEMVKVTSAGPDREFGNRDDIVAERMAMNFKGVGEGIKKNAGSVAREVAQGTVEGVVDGVSEKVGAAAEAAKNAVKKRLPSFKRETKDPQLEPEPLKNTDN